MRNLTKSERPSWAYVVEFRREGDEIHGYCEALPEAIAAGPTEDDAAHEMQLAVDAAARGRMKDGLDLPMPDVGGEGRYVFLSTMLSAKAAVYQAWRQAAVTKSELARRMGRTETEVRRVLDPDHGTKLDQLEEAARALGGRLQISFAAASARAPHTRIGIST